MKGLLAAKDEKSAKAIAPAPPPPRDDGPERAAAARTLQRFCRSVADDGPLLWQAPRLFGCAGAADLLLGTAAGWRRVRRSASLDVRGERLAKATLERLAALRLTAVDLTGAGRGDGDLLALQPLLPTLERLVLNDWPELASLHEFFRTPAPRLRVLSVAECSRLGDGGVAIVWELPALVDLCLYGCPLLTPRCARGLHKDAPLARLNISGCYKLGDDFLRLLFHAKPHCVLYTNPNDNAP